MFYEFLKILMRLTFPFWFRNITILGKNNIPTDKPVIFACNHPNAFMDALAASTYVPKQVHYLVRSDIFNTAFKRWLLWQMNQIPIYRLEEGWNNLKKNRHTFTACINLLGQKKVLLVFSEGNCVQEKRLRPLKKGTARIVMETESAFSHSPGLQIVPVGVNYSRPSQAGSDLIVSYGSPIPAKDFMKSYKEHPATAFNEFNGVLYEKMAEQLIIIEDKKDKATTELLLEMLKNDMSVSKRLNPGKKDRQFFSRQKDLSEKVSSLSSEDKKELRKVVAAYKKELSDAGITDRSIARTSDKWLPLRTIFFVLLFPLFFAGAIANILPYYLSSIITENKVKMKEFHVSVKFGLSLIFFLLYYIGIFIALAILFTPLISLISLLATMITGIIAVPYYRKIRLFVSDLRFAFFSEAARNALRKKRASLMKMVSS